MTVVQKRFTDAEGNWRCGSCGWLLGWPDPHICDSERGRSPSGGPDMGAAIGTAGHAPSDAAHEREYLVEVTVRETYTMVVRASSKKQARERALGSGLSRDDAVIETWQNGDRQMTGVKGVTLAD